MKRNKMNIPDLYIGAGKWLNDKDRNVNSDLVEIHDFFSPIDRLFGDYETRKKFDLHEQLYRKNEDGKVVTIPKSQLINNRNKGNNDINESIVYILTITYNESKKEYFLNYKPISINELLDGDSMNTNELFFPVIDQYILDPTKLYHIIDLDGARFSYFIRDFCNKNGIVKSKYLESFIESFAKVKNFFRRHSRIFKVSKNQGLNIYGLENIIKENEGYFKQLGENVDEIINDIKSLKEKGNEGDKLINILNKEKLKNFERFEQVKLRLGQYEDGRFVIYLHPYESEANCPGRIPAE